MKKIGGGWLALALVATALGGIAASLSRSSPQPVRYNHKLHVELDLECKGCHAHAENGIRASLPGMEICADCHDDVESENREAGKVAGYVARGERIPWRRVHRVPDHVYFSHRRHVRLGELQCPVCHGDVAQMEQPFEEPRQEIRMSWCIDCHQRRGVDNDCFACHR